MQITDIISRNIRLIEIGNSCSTYLQEVQTPNGQNCTFAECVRQSVYDQMKDSKG